MRLNQKIKFEKETNETIIKLKNDHYTIKLMNETIK